MPLIDGDGHGGDGEVADGGAGGKQQRSGGQQSGGNLGDAGVGELAVGRRGGPALGARRSPSASSSGVCRHPNTSARRCSGFRRRRNRRLRRRAGRSSLSGCDRPRSLGTAGKRAAVAGSRAAGGRPSSLARTGSKSTNQLWNSARAIASSVAFIRRFNSILSSSAPSTAAMAFCSARGGSVIANLRIALVQVGIQRRLHAA